MERARNALAALRPQHAPDPSLEGAVGVPDVLGEIGAALLTSSQATSDVEQTLRRLATRYGREDLRVFVLPTLILIEDHSTSPAQTAFFPAYQDTLRLDQAGAVDQVVRRAVDSRMDPGLVVASIAEIRRTPARFGPALTVLGHALLTVGFGMVLNPTVTALPVYIIVGAIVGLIGLVGNRVATLSLILPVVTAFTVTLLISVVVRPLVHDDVLRLAAPALVSFLPGLTLTIAAVELTAGQVMAGASRLIYGVARLGLLAFGVYAGITVAGEPPSVTSHPVQLGSWAPWVGILLVSIGYYFYSAAPRRSLVWILFALLVAYSAQLLGNTMVGAELSGLVGAVIVIPVVRLAGRIKAAPSTVIMLTCAYWILVPGSMGFIGLSEAAAGTAGAGSVLLRTFGSLLAIAIGMVVGAGLSHDVVVVRSSWRSKT
ncbi:threonine/serine exporter family protein [Isoptericola halotolerans]|uniref:threonine/serine ThrE exporter family protein n=1 Tax=Isoptericola halotolerans TaxID=300560 RepID=UPI00388E7521